MKLSFTLITILILATWANGQMTPAPSAKDLADLQKHIREDEKKRAKLEEKAAKEQAKIDKKAAELERKKMTVDFAQVTRFPSSYVGGMRRLAFVGLGDIQPFRDGDMTVYLVRISSGYDSTAGALFPEALTVAMDEDTARSYVTAIENLKRHDVYSMNRTIPGDVYFEIYQREEQGQRYFIAKVSCVAIYGGFDTSLMASVGSCPSLK